MRHWLRWIGEWGDNMNRYIIKIDSQYLSGFLYKSLYLTFEETNAEVIKGEEELKSYLAFITDLKAKGSLKFKSLTYEQIEG